MRSLNGNVTLASRKVGVTGGGAAPRCTVLCQHIRLSCCGLKVIMQWNRS